MVESVRGRNKEQRARLLLGYQVADSVSKLHPLTDPPQDLLSFFNVTEDFAADRRFRAQK